MSWVLFLQIVLLMVLLALLIIAVAYSIVDDKKSLYSYKHLVDFGDITPMLGATATPKEDDK